MVRSAVPCDKNGVNALRKQVHMLHCNNRPDMFKCEFDSSLADRFDTFLSDSDYTVLVYENERKEIAGYAVLKKVRLESSPYAPVRKFLLIEEIGVEEKCRRSGIGSQLVEEAKKFAETNGFNRVQLDVWAFNEKAERFYEKCGFETYRSYLEFNVK